MPDNGQFLYNRPTFPAQLNMAHPLTRGLVGCWVLNENSPDSMRAWDSSLYQNHGAVTGAKGYWQGRIFNGTDYIEGTNHSALNFTSGDFSILAWIKPTNFDGGRRIFQRGLLNADGYLFLGSGTSLYCYTNQAGANQENASTASLTLSAWQLASVVRSGTAITFYKDGMDITGTPVAITNPLTSTRTFKIGIDDDLVSVPFLGTYGGLVIYSRALIAAEIQWIYLEPYAMFL